MIRAMLTVAVLMSGGAATGQDRERLPVPEADALAEFHSAADEAEAACLESAVGGLRVFLSRLEDAERATVREERIEDANRIRRLADRFRGMAEEAARHVNLGGVLPRPGEPHESLGIGQEVAECREDLASAVSAYRQALEAARTEAVEAMEPALTRAIRAGDLDAANAVTAAEEEIDRAIRDRLRPLAWREYRFSSSWDLERKFVVAEPEMWRVVDGELIGTAREGEQPEITAAPAFGSISAVTIRARIVPPATTNLRLGVGPVNVIFNWERARESHFRYHEARTIVPGLLLTPGREHEITVRQLTRRSIEVLVDGERAWITHGTLEGTVTLYPIMSTIGVRGIRILGVPETARWPDGPSHRRW